MPVITVTQVNKYISSKLQGDRILQGIMVKGEITNFVYHEKSGHRYFSLKDKESKLPAVMYASAGSRLKFELENGMEVIASGSISVYEREGKYQFNVNDIIPEGIGKENLALEQLKKKLAAEGIFSPEHKRPLPVMPKKIGYVTSFSGAVIHDVISVLSRRYPLCELHAVDTLVQGGSAPENICRGIIKAENAGCDVIIVGRGGGSTEELSAYNTEPVARAIYGCKVPVISAVGHEINLTLADLAADMRASTPSVAAELAVPDKKELAEKIDNYIRRCKNAALSVINKKESAYSSASLRLEARSPENNLKLMRERLESLVKRANTAMQRNIDKNEARLAQTCARLDSISPLKVMARGYSLVYSGDTLVRTSDDINEGQTVSLRFSEGSAEAMITKKW